MGTVSFHVRMMGMSSSGIILYAISFRQPPFKTTCIHTRLQPTGHDLRNPDCPRTFLPSMHVMHLDLNPLSVVRRRSPGIRMPVLWTPPP